MSFQIKDFVSIVASMVNYARGTTTQFTDFNVGSKVRTMLEASAIEIEELYQQMLNGLVQAIPVSVFNTFSFGLLQPTAASFTVRIVLSTAAPAQTITAGTMVTPASGTIVYATVDDTVVAADAPYVDVLVAATTTGSATNIAAGSTFTVSPAPANYVSASTLTGGTNGTDLETEGARLTRFQSYIQTLQRATVAALQYGLSTVTLMDASGNVTERVALQQVIEPWVTNNAVPVGLVACYIHNGVGSTSTDLVTQALITLQGYYTTAGVGVPGYKAAGVQLTVAAATEQPVNVTGILITTPSAVSATVEAAVQAAISAYLLSLNIGQAALLAEIYAIVMAVPGVYNWTPTAPTADVQPTSTVGYKIMPGVIHAGVGGAAPLDEFYLDQNVLI